MSANRTIIKFNGEKLVEVEELLDYKIGELILIGQENEKNDLYEVIDTQYDVIKRVGSFGYIRRYFIVVKK